MKELFEQLKAAREKLLAAKTEQLKGSLKDTSSIKKAKKEVAQIMTKINTKKNEN